MTWTWTLTKMGVGIGLSMISANPVGWAIGIPTSQFIKSENYKRLNSSTLSLSDKVESQRWIELSTDYQWGAGIGMVGGAVISTATKEMANKTLSIGREASKEIAIHGFKTEVARTLITSGQLISKIETIIKAVPNLHKLEERVKALVRAVKEVSLASNEKEFIESANILIQAQNLFISDIEKDLIEKKNLLNTIRKNILELNKKNIELFIKYEKNQEEHHRINREINTMLTIIKGLQKKLHTEGNCCEKRLFCWKG